MNLENMLMVGLCLAAVAALVWFLWNKLSSQQQETDSLRKRLEAIELAFTRPPPPDDLNAMLVPRQTYDSPDVNRRPERRTRLSPGEPGTKLRPEDLDTDWELEGAQRDVVASANVCIATNSCSVSGLCGIEELSTEDPALPKPQQLDLIADEMAEKLGV
jgi:hypothetical protein